MSLLIDTGASMEQRLAVAQEAAIGFARRLGPQDLAQVVDFDSRVEIAQGYEIARPSRLLAEMEGDRPRVSGGVVPLIEGTVSL